MFDLIILFYYWCVDVCRLWMSTDLQDVNESETYKQCYVYNDSHIDVCFENEKGELNTEMKRNLRHGFVFCFWLFCVLAGLNVCGIEIRKVAIFEGEIELMYEIMGTRVFLIPAGTDPLLRHRHNPST